MLGAGSSGPYGRHVEAAKRARALTARCGPRLGVVVLEVEDRPGVLADLTLKAARAGIDLDLVYVATRTGSSSGRRSRQVEGRAGAGVALPTAVRRRRRPRLGRLVVHRRAGDDVLQPEDAVQPAALVDHAAPGVPLDQLRVGREHERGEQCTCAAIRARAEDNPVAAHAPVARLRARTVDRLDSALSGSDEEGAR